MYYGCIVMDIIAKEITDSKIMSKEVLFIDSGTPKSGYLMYAQPVLKSN